MTVQFSKNLFVRTFFDDTYTTTQSSENEFFLCSRLNDLTDILAQLDELNCETTTYLQFYKHIHPRISSMLDIETKMHEFQKSDPSSEKVRSTILEKIKLLKEKNWELCDHFNKKYQPLSPKSRQRLLAIKSIEDLSLTDT